MLTVSSIVILLIAFLIFKTIIIVTERENVVVERLGKFNAVLKPGFHFLLPFFDKAAYRREMREQVIDIPAQSVITKDNIQVTVDGLLYIKVMDPKKASYGIGSYIAASRNLAQTTMRSEIGKITLGETFAERDKVNSNIIREIDKASDPWGVKVLRYEIKDISPTSHVRDTLERQMEAEREKRAQITMATAEKEKLINISEGKRQHAINISTGEKQKRINEALGRAESIKLVADATAKSVQMVGEAVSGPGGSKALRMKLVDQYVDSLNSIMAKGNVSMFPAGLATLKGIFDEIGFKSGPRAEKNDDTSQLENKLLKRKSLIKRRRNV